MRTGFIFKRLDGITYDLTTKGYMPYKPEIQLPVRQIQSEPILGKDSTLTFDYENYEDRPITVPIFFMNPSNRREFNSVFNGIGGTLKFNYKDGFYKVKTIDKVFERDAKGIPEIDLFLTLAPFLYMDKAKETLTLSSTDRVKSFNNNKGNIPSKGAVTIYGNGNIDITINGIDFVLTGISTKITLNSELLTCYKDTENCNSKVNGSLDKLVVKAGTNTINARVGTVTKVEIEYEPTIFE